MTMTMDLIRHIAGLYSGKAIKGDFTQVYITGNEIWMAQQILAEQAEGAQGEREAFEAAHRSLFGKRMVVPGYEDAPYEHREDYPELYSDSGVQDGWRIWQARAALAQPSPKCATCNDRGHVCLDWEAGAWDECPDRKAQEPQNCPTFMGEPIAQPYEAPRDKINALFKALGFSGTASVGDILDAAIERVQAQPSPAPELERPEVVGKFDGLYIIPLKPMEKGDELMTVAQHDRIVGALRAENETLKAALAKWIDRAENWSKANDAAQAGQVPDIDTMVSRFLSWPLPASVCADSCVSLINYPNRYGTHLLTGVEAKAMLEHVIAAAPAQGD